MGATEFIGKIKSEILVPAVTLMMALGVLYFLYGVFVFIKGANSEEARSTGRRHMMWGVFGLFLMVSVLGIMNLICDTLGAGC